MSVDVVAPPPPVVLDDSGLQALIDVLAGRGLRVLGPTPRDGVVSVGELRSIDDLPAGCFDEQAPGRYRLIRSDRPERFGWTVGPQTWKTVLHAPEVRIDVTPRTSGASSDGAVPEPAGVAFVGVRPCELAAIERLDQVLLDGVAVEPHYGAAREGLFVVGVDCTNPASTCFCASAGTGPAVSAGDAVCDLRLTEIVTDGVVSYLTSALSERGRSVLDDVVAGSHSVAPPTGAMRRAAEAAAEDAAARAAGRIDVTELHGALLARHDHRGWNDVAERCVACGNCTAVCPTCFCTSTLDGLDLTGEVPERERRWATCFDPEFSRLGGSPVRATVAARYRQWLTHKLDTWHDQFGESGCVGCGRCITWCPVGIDLTAEAAAITEPAVAGHDASYGQTRERPRRPRGAPGHRRGPETGGTRS